jgi:hypothetical protein
MKAYCGRVADKHSYSGDRYQYYRPPGLVYNGFHLFTEIHVGCAVVLSGYVYYLYVKLTIGSAEPFPHSAMMY